MTFHLIVTFIMFICTIYEMNNYLDKYCSCQRKLYIERENENLSKTIYHILLHNVMKNIYAFYLMGFHCFRRES